MKIVINTCYGRFDLSANAQRTYESRSGLFPGSLIARILDRDDPTLVRIVEEMGPYSYGYSSVLTVVDIPDDIEWEIVEYDGLEYVAEKRRTWH